MRPSAVVAPICVIVSQLVVTPPRSITIAFSVLSSAVTWTTAIPVAAAATATTTTTTTVTATATVMAARTTPSPSSIAVIIVRHFRTWRCTAARRQHHRHSRLHPTASEEFAASSRTIRVNPWRDTNPPIWHPPRGGLRWHDRFASTIPSCNPEDWWPRRKKKKRRKMRRTTR